MADKIRSQVGNPTVLINNAGVARGKTIMDAEPADVRFTFDVNTLSHYWITKAFLPSMIRRNHGMIVTVTSQASWLTAPFIVDYCASKAAAMAFHEGLSAELKAVYNAPRVRTVAVHPAHTKTPLFNGFNQHDNFMFPSLEVETMAEGIVKQVLTGRSGNVVLPETGNIVPLLRVVPDFISYHMRSQGVKYMKTWNGKQVIADIASPYEPAEKHSDTGDSTVLVSGKGE